MQLRMVWIAASDLVIDCYLMPIFTRRHCRCKPGKVWTGKRVVDSELYSWGRQNWAQPSAVGADKVKLIPLRAYSWEELPRRIAEKKYEEEQKKYSN